MEIIKQFITGNLAVHFSSESNEWGTPPALFDELDQEFGFTLDPCASFDNAKVGRFYTQEDDGLAQDWTGERVFCNPPYGRAIGAWVAKCAAEAKRCPVVVMLIPARTDTAYFHDYIYGLADIRFIRGRVKFEHADGRRGGGARLSRL